MMKSFVMNKILLVPIFLQQCWFFTYAQAQEAPVSIALRFTTTSGDDIATVCHPLAQTKLQELIDSVLAEVHDEREDANEEAIEFPPDNGSNDNDRPHRPSPPRTFVNEQQSTSYGHWQHFMKETDDGKMIEVSDDSDRRLMMEEEQQRRSLQYCDLMCRDMCWYTGQSFWCGCCACCGAGRRRRRRQLLRLRQLRQIIETDDDLQDMAEDIKENILEEMETPKYRHHLDCLEYDNGFRLTVILTRGGSATTTTTTTRSSASLAPPTKVATYGAFP